MALVLDAAALVAVERGEPRAIALLLAASRSGVPVRTSAAVVAQVWRDPARQVRLVRALRGIDQVPLDALRATRVGELLRATKTTDVVDGAVVELTADGDDVVTADVEDLARLSRAAGRAIRLLRP